MKTLIILDRAGLMNTQYAIVKGDKSKYSGLVLNGYENEYSKECLSFLEDGMKNDEIIFTFDLSELSGTSYDKTALIATI